MVEVSKKSLYVLIMIFFSKFEFKSSLIFNKALLTF